MDTALAALEGRVEARMAALDRLEARLEAREALVVSWERDMLLSVYAFPCRSEVFHDFPLCLTSFGSRA